MSATTFEASRLIRQVAPYVEGANEKSRMAHAAARLRWKLSRVQDIWSANRKIRVRAEEIERLRRLTDPPETVAVNDTLAALRAEREALRGDLQELRRERARIATLLDRIERTDADFGSPMAAAARDQVQLLDRTNGAPRGPGDRSRP